MYIIINTAIYVALSINKKNKCLAKWKILLSMRKCNRFNKLSFLGELLMYNV